MTVDDRKWKCSGDGGGKTMEMWRRQWMKDNGNVVVVVEERHWKCGGGNGRDNENVVGALQERQWKCGRGSGGGGVGKAIEM